MDWDQACHRDCFVALLLAMTISLLLTASAVATRGPDPRGSNLAKILLRLTAATGKPNRAFRLIIEKPRPAAPLPSLSPSGGEGWGEGGDGVQSAGMEPGRRGAGSGPGFAGTIRGGVMTMP